MADFTNAKAAELLRIVAHDIEKGRKKVDGIFMVVAFRDSTRVLTIGDEVAAGCALGSVVMDAKAELSQYMALGAASPSAAVN